MADTRAPPTFHTPQLVQTPEVDLTLNDKTYITDGILYRSFKTILPLDPQVPIFIKLPIDKISFHFISPHIVSFHFIVLFSPPSPLSGTLS